MAPVADAVGFIHRQRHQLALIMQILQQLAAGLTLQALRREIQQPQRALLNLLLQLTQLLQRQAVVQTSRAMPRRRSCATWSCIKATSGEITSTTPLRTRAGS